jgi:WD40 repeat protein
MSRLARRLAVLVPAVLLVLTVGVWAYRTLNPPPAGQGPPPPELATATVAGVRFEIEHRPGEYVASSTDDSMTVLRGAELLEFADGYVSVNDIGLPNVKPGDTVRWNLTGPLLVNGVPQEPHPLQARELGAADTELHWTPRPSAYPRDTLSVAWLSTTRRLVAAHGDGVVRVWDADKAAVLTTLVPDPPKETREAWGLRAAASPDGKTIAVTNLNGEEVTLWDAATGNRTATFSEPKEKVSEVRYAGEGLLLESRGGVLLLRDLFLKPPVAFEVGRVHTQFLLPFAASAGSSTAAWNDGSKVSIGRVGHVIPGADAPAFATIAGVSDSGRLALSSDGKLLALFNGENRLTLHDATTGKLLHRLRWRVEDRTKPLQITALAFTPDGKTLAVGDVSSIRFYDVATGRERGGLASGWVRSLAYSADGKTLAAGLRHAPGLVLWDTAELK